jgi:hypothetical protein
MFFGVNLQITYTFCKLYRFMFVGVKLQRPSLQQRACKIISKFLYKIDSWDQSNQFFLVNYSLHTHFISYTVSYL